ncbi:fibronectin type III domain-containing protein [Curtobacterium sp. 22159]|uniref:fibronectin type III domain-containing protein n=1 Tax=Curtobacterium sp. 22159 TaxID=3453882 RepID=UPI003F85469E
MYRAVLTAAAAVALVIGGAGPATAAPSSSVPGAPTSVTVTGAADSATVTWGKPRSRARVTGWQVVVTPAEHQPDHGVDRLPASARSDRFGALTPRTTYTFAVRALGARGAGSATSVRYTAPAVTTTTQSLFALDAAGDVVRFPTSGSGALRTVATDGAGFTADDVGDVFTPSADRTSILLHPADGSAVRTLATGLHLTADLRSDAAGNLYWIDSVTGVVDRLPVTGGAPQAWVHFGPAPNSSYTTLWAVGRDGTVSTWAGTVSSAVVTTASPSGAVTTRTVTPGAAGVLGYVRALLADTHGNLFFDWSSPGGAGSFIWAALPAGATSPVSAEPKLAFEYGAVGDDTFSLLQSAGWCTSPAEYSPAGCGADRSVTSLVVRSADGTTVTKAVSGLTAGSRGANVGAADDDGDVFVDIDSGPTPGLWRVPAAGGAAERLSSAQYSRLLVI